MRRGLGSDKSGRTLTYGALLLVVISPAFAFIAIIGFTRGDVAFGLFVLTIALLTLFAPVFARGIHHGFSRGRGAADGSSSLPRMALVFSVGGSAFAVAGVLSIEEGDPAAFSGLCLLMAGGMLVLGLAAFLGHRLRRHGGPAARERGQ